METGAALDAPNVLVVSSSRSFRTHVGNWLPSPAINVVESEGHANLQQRIAASRPVLVVVDREFEGYTTLLSDLASLVPGVPYLSVSLEHTDPDNRNSFEIAKGWVAREYPTRASALAAIREVAPAVAARLD